jgi:predicted transposase YbfD/YdcC
VRKEWTAGDNAVPFWSFSTLRAVFTSSAGRPCVDQELIAEKEGEAPAFRVVFRRMTEHFSRLFLIVTADAGMTCRENALVVMGAGKHYLFALKGNQERLFTLAQRWLQPGLSALRAYTTEYRNRLRVDRELYTLTVNDAVGMDFPGAQQLWCVRQVVTNKEGELVSAEVRYFLSSIPPKLLTPHEQLSLVRLHWGIENGHNWTRDVMLKEDDRQPCQASREAIDVVCWLRIIGYNLLAAWRSRAPLKDKLPQPWRRAMELLRDALVGAFAPEDAPAPLA